MSTPKKIMITNMSSKGQIVIPNEFRKSLGLNSGTPLAVFTDGSVILLRPIEMPNIGDFGRLLKESKNAAKKAGLKRSDIKSTIKRARNESRS
ncbi:MAG: AbrB/MazE/SpoVT family DNA-binding domain-containing protein [Oligoflexia bacterium]|nr:AbrB/MazE/SpoVT family DNA-binding domain-containing protein [Oligoflexia bacterium]